MVSLFVEYHIYCKSEYKCTHSKFGCVPALWPECFEETHGAICTTSTVHSNIVNSLAHSRASRLGFERISRKYGGKCPLIDPADGVEIYAVTKA